MERRCPSGLGRLDDAEVQHLLKLGLGGDELVPGEPPSSGKDGRTSSGHGVPDAMSREGVRIVVADEDGRELSKNLLEDGGARTMKAVELRTVGGQRVDDGQRREEMTPVRRKAEKTPTLEID